MPFLYIGEPIFLVVEYSTFYSDLHISAYDLPNLGVLVRFISFKSAQLTGINRAFQAKESLFVEHIYNSEGMTLIGIL